MPIYSQIKNRKLITVGLALLLIGAIYRLYPDADNMSDQNAYGHKHQQLLKYRQLVAQKKAIQKALATSRRTLVKAEEMLLQGDTPAIAAVKIQGLLQRIAIRRDINVASTRFLDPIKLDMDAYEGLLAIPIQFSVDIPIRKLNAMLFELETSDKLLTVNEIRARAKSTGGKELISATLIVWGYYKEKPENGLGF